MEQPSFTLPEIPIPLMFNPLKHHIEALQGLIAQALGREESAMDELAKVLQPLGGGLMDFYHGGMSIGGLCTRLLAHLDEQGASDHEAYRAWIAHSGTYRTLTLDEDQSIWVFFPSDDEERFAHLHPARYSPHTTRIRANTLKTVTMAIIHAAHLGAQPRDLAIINAVRTRWLELSPLPHLNDSAALEVAFQLFGA
jgi:hypothetical protein